MSNSTAPLNLSERDIARAGELLIDLLKEHERMLPQKRILPALNRPVLEQLLHADFPRNGIGIEALFEEIRDKVVPNSTATSHPRFLAYVLGPPNGIAPFAEAIAATLNQNCNFWQLSPAANVIEQKVINWLSGLFDYPDTAGGILTSGGSVATLTAIATALCDKCPADFRQTGLQSLAAPLVLYTSTQAHGSVEKAAMILGLGSNHVRRIPVDANFRMRVDLLRAAVAEDIKAGRQPFCVVASGGTINTGAIDPMHEIAAFCRQEDLWLHVDGAYGALFVLAEQTKDALRVCGLADSIVLDPHKLLFAPLEAGCLIVRDREKLRRAFSASSAYLPADQDPLLMDFMDYGPQLSRGFKAFKIWCALQTFGVDAFARAADHMLQIARYLQERIAGQEALELMAPVNLSAVCFGLRGGSDDDNRSLLARLVDEGTALLGPVRIDNRFGLRACITNYRTTRRDIDFIIERLLALAVTR